MLIIVPHLRRDIRIHEDGRGAIWFGCDSRALDILVITKSDVHRRIPSTFQKLSARVLIEHALAERAEFLPFEATILRPLSVNMLNK